MSTINPYESASTDPTSNFSAAVGSVQIVGPLVEKAGWMKFIGVLYIIYGALCCLSIIGAIVGVPFIFAGINLYQAATNYQLGYPQNSAILLEASRKLGTSLMIVGILFAIGLVLTLLYFAFVLIVVIASVGAAATSQ